jgi:23S rRNA (guanosine2251-2'-O)-methyltransferase
VAYLSPIPFVSVEAFLSAPAQGLMVALIGLTDVRNVGAILRSGAAFGVKAILWPTSKSVSPSNDELWRSSAGALRQLTIVRSQRPHSDIQRLAEHGWRLVATTRATPQATPLHHWSWNCPSLLLLGNEEKGLPAAYMNLTPFHLTIPHDPRMESLNVSAAAAIFFWHYYQGRHT